MYNQNPNNLLISLFWSCYKAGIDYHLGFEEYLCLTLMFVFIHFSRGMNQTALSWEMKFYVVSGQFDVLLFSNVPYGIK